MIVNGGAAGPVNFQQQVAALRQQLEALQQQRNHQQQQQQQNIPNLLNLLGLRPQVGFILLLIVLSSWTPELMF